MAVKCVISRAEERFIANHDVTKGLRAVDGEHGGQVLLARGIDQFLEVEDNAGIREYVAQNRDVRLLFEANPHQRGNDLVGWPAIPEQALKSYRLQPEPVYGLKTIFQHGAYGAMFGVARPHARRPCAAGIQQFAQRKLQCPGCAIVQRNPLGVHAQKGFQIPEEGTHTAPGNGRASLRYETPAGIRVRWRYKTGARSQFLLDSLVGRGTVGRIEASDVPIQLVDGGSPLNTLGVGHDGQVLQQASGDGPNPITGSVIETIRLPPCFAINRAPCTAPSKCA